MLCILAKASHVSSPTAAGCPVLQNTASPPAFGVELIQHFHQLLAAGTRCILIKQVKLCAPWLKKSPNITPGYRCPSFQMASRHRVAAAMMSRLSCVGVGSLTDALLSAARNKQWENLFRFAIHTGLRSSELCALSWHDIDFVGRTIHVQNASVVGVIKGTKTKAGTRKVELADEAMKALINQKPFTFMKDEIVFEDPKTNKPWASADAIRKKVWLPTLRKAGIRYRNPYRTRHTFATRHISQGANLFWLAGQMGHKGPEML